MDIAGEMAQEGANWLEKKLFSSDSPTPEDSAENSEAVKEQAGEMAQEAKVETEGIK